MIITSFVNTDPAEKKTNNQKPKKFLLRKFKINIKFYKNTLIKN
jgi:hypothetical protein